MEVTIIDNTPTRLSKLKNFLENLQAIDVQQAFEVNDGLANNRSKLFLIHKSNDAIATFVPKITSEKFILFFSGGGITQDIEGIAYSDKMFNLPDVFNVGNEEQSLSRIKQIVEIVKNEFNNTNAITEITKVLGFDEQLEKLLEPFAASNPFKQNDTLKQAKEALNNYINSKT